MAITEDLPAGL